MNDSYPKIGDSIGVIGRDNYFALGKEVREALKDGNKLFLRTHMPAKKKKKKCGCR